MLKRACSQSCREFTLQLWLRPSASLSRAKCGELPPVPILAIGTPDAADLGSCDANMASVVLSQSSGCIELAVAKSVRSYRGNTYYCFRAELEGPVSQSNNLFIPQALFTPSPKPRQLTVVFERAKPVRSYLDGQRISHMYTLPAGDPAQALYPQFAQWPASHKVFIAPVPSSARSSTHSPPRGWDGDVYQLSMYASALNASAVMASYREWLPNSLPLAPTVRVDTEEDTPVLVQLSGSDTFDASFSPRAQQELTVLLSSLPRVGLLFLDGVDGATRTPVSAAQLPLHVPGGRLWYVPKRDIASARVGVAADEFRYAVLSGRAIPALASARAVNSACTLPHALP
eukprot:6210945-Pleurochrysis_carterae.AAC.3